MPEIMWRRLAEAPSDQPVRAIARAGTVVHTSAVPEVPVRRRSCVRTGESFRAVCSVPRPRPLASVEGPQVAAAAVDP